MKKISILSLCLIIFLMCSGFTNKRLEVVDKGYITEEIKVCSSSSVKSYMSYKMVKNSSSKQYKYIKNNMKVNEETGLLEDEDGFIGVALGSYFGEIGSKFYVTLDSGVVLPIVKVEAKSDMDTENGCKHINDNSVIEFVVDTNLAGEYFGVYRNGYILGGNFNNDEHFKGRIEKIEKIVENKADEKINERVIDHVNKLVLQ